MIRVKSAFLLKKEEKKKLYILIKENVENLKRSGNVENKGPTSQTCLPAQLQFSATTEDPSML